MGKIPSWYPLIRASRYLGVAPWELLKAPAVWIDLALMAEGAENEGETIRLRRGT